MPSGYEDQQPDPTAEARFQQFINAPGSPGANLRDAFAQLLAQGSGQAMPMDALMAAQMRAQMPQLQPDPTIVRPREMGDSTTTDLPMRAPNPGAAADLAFPTAKAYEDPRLKSSAIPFPGAKEIEVTPYGLPPSSKPLRRDLGYDAKLPGAEDLPKKSKKKKDKD